MALTTFQRTVCRLLADHRIASGESDVTGASALNELLAASRVSMDIDLFHDTEEALEASWDADRRMLETHGFDLRIIRERRGFVEAEVGKNGETGETVLMQWAHDSAYRFFPLVYSAAEVLSLAFATEPPDPADLSRRWHAMLVNARPVVAGWPYAEVGRCVLSRAGALFAGDAAAPPRRARSRRARLSSRPDPGRHAGAPGREARRGARWVGPTFSRGRQARARAAGRATSPGSA
jgi:hypothetical protein